MLPEEHYVGEFDNISLEWPTVPYSHKICRCCYDAGIFETIYNREEPVPGPCACIHVKSLSPTITEKDDSQTLGRMGWRVCLIMAFFPLALPFRACAQHKKIKDIYPVETEIYKVRNLQYIIFESGTAECSIIHFPWGSYPRFSSQKERFLERFTRFRFLAHREAC